jgi:hypothetical protein
MVRGTTIQDWSNGTSSHGQRIAARLAHHGAVGDGADGRRLDPVPQLGSRDFGTADVIERGEQGAQPDVARRLVDGEGQVRGSWRRSNVGLDALSITVASGEINPG